MKTKLKFLLAAGASVLALGSAVASQDHAQHGAAAPAAASTAMTAGEVRKVDVAQGKVTIKHDPIANLDMPAMTMVFRVAKPEMLTGLATGDKVQFHAESANGAIQVTHIQVQK